jgi:hypothetical protein
MAMMMQFGYGQGSSTLATWIRNKAQEHGVDVPAPSQGDG